MENFNTLWLRKVAANIAKYSELEIMSEVDKYSTPLEQTRELIRLLKLNFSNEEIHDILTESACFYSRDDLRPFAKLYKETDDLELVHRKLQEKFEKDIVNYKSLSDSELQYIKDHNWGIAGKLDGTTILATKIPAEFHEYFKSNDSQEKQSLYCHCPRIKESIKNGEAIPYEYCYCGGGYYRDIWKTITQSEVKIEIIQSILKGDEVCQFKIHIDK